MAISRRRRTAAGACLFFGLAAAAWLRFGVPGPASAARIGETLPHMLVDQSGIELDLTQLAAGRRSVVVFYSPACRSCREELPCLSPFPPSLRLIMVREPGAADVPDLLRLPEATLVHDRRRGLSRSLGLAVIPVILFVDERGILRDGLVGLHPRALVRDRLTEFADRAD